MIRIKFSWKSMLQLNKIKRKSYSFPLPAACTRVKIYPLPIAGLLSGPVSVRDTEK